MKFCEELFPFEAELSNLGPRKGVDFRKVLEDQDPGVNDGEIQGNSFMILNKLNA